MIKKRAIPTIFAILFLIFVIVWITKAKNPVVKEEKPSGTDGKWYNKEVVTTPSDEWILDPEIPENYIPVPGENEVYMVIDTQGTVTQYRQRIQDSDGMWVWSTIEKTDIDNQNSYELAANVISGDVYSVTTPEGIISYIRYTRNDDNSYAFTDCDKNGEDLDTPIDSTIPYNYVWLTGNIYTVYNEYGVLTSFKERFVDEDGNYYWVTVGKPDMSPKPSDTESDSDNQPSGGLPSIITDGSTVQDGTVSNDDGTYTTTTTYREQKTVGNYVITYETAVIKTFNSSGELVSTLKNGPYEIDRSIAIIQPEEADQSRILSTLDEEQYRVCSDKNFDTDIVNNLVDLLNAERNSSGLNSVSLDTSSALYKMAQIKAADMAIYDHSSANSEMYGSLSELASRYGVRLSNPNESLIKSMPMTASQIHSRLQAVTSSREARMSSSVSKIAIAVIEYNGYYYIYECYE